MATTTVTPDPETMDLNELRLLAEAEAIKATTTQPVKQAAVVIPDAVADPDVVADPDPAVAAVAAAPKTVVVQRSFDLGDGAGVQIFKGKGATKEDALDDLADKQIEAQRNATKRIKELKETKVVETPKGPTKEETDNESLLAAEVVSNPSKAVEKILKSKGIDLSELPEMLAEVKQTRALKQRKAIADEFVAKHPDFVDNERNGQRLNKAIRLFGDFTLENFEKAYQDLSASGLLEVKGEEAGDGQTADEVEQQRIVAEAKQLLSSQRTRRASGISTHHTVVVPKVANPTEDDMYAMSIDELRTRAIKQLAG